MEYDETEIEDEAGEILDEIDALENEDDDEAADGVDEFADEQSGPLQGGAMSPAEAKSKMKELIATPGYATGQLRYDNPGAYERIVREVAALAAIGARGNAEKDVEALREFEAARSKKKDELREAAEVEMGKLEALGFEPAEIPEDVSDVDLRALKEQRLYAEGGVRRACADVVRGLGLFGAVGRYAAGQNRCYPRTHTHRRR